MARPALVLPVRREREALLAEATRLPVDGGVGWPKRPVALLVGLIVATVVSVALVFASVFPLMFSPMLFDSGATAVAWTVFIAAWSVPLLVLAALVIAWIGFAARVYWMIWIAAVLAALPVVVLAGVFALAL
jgi:hypothetical protein